MTESKTPIIDYLAKQAQLEPPVTQAQLAAMQAQIDALDTKSLSDGYRIDGLVSRELELLDMINALKLEVEKLKGEKKG